MVLPGLLVVALLTGNVWFGLFFLVDVLVIAMYLVFAIMNQTEIALVMFPAFAETEHSDTSEKLNGDILGQFPIANRTTKEILQSLSSTVGENNST